MVIVQAYLTLNFIWLLQAEESVILGAARARFLFPLAGRKLAFSVAKVGRDRPITVTFSRAKICSDA